MAILSSILSFLGENTRILDGLIKAEPGKLWHVLILGTFSFIRDYGWRIVLFTVLLKLILSPLDYFQRYKMHKNQKITERLKPTMEKIQKQYGDNKQAFSQKQMELNRKEGYSYFSSCLPMIVTLVVFITLWQAMTTVGQYMTFLQYGELHDAYYAAYEPIYDAAYRDIYESEYEKSYAEKFQDIYDELIAGKEATEGSEAVAPKTPEEATEEATKRIEKLADEQASAFAKNKAQPVAQEVVYELYYNGISEDFLTELRKKYELPETYTLDTADEVRARFLWIDNIWAPDVPWGNNAILNWKSFKSAIGMKDDDNKVPTKYKLTAEQNSEINGLTYNDVMGKLIAEPKRKANGYLILPILVVLLSLGTQLLSMFQQKRAGQVNAKGGAATSMKVMMFIMPIMMVFFALRYASIFTLYMVVNNAMSLVINLSSTAIVKAVDKRKRRRSYGITTGSTRAAVMYKKSPIIHYVKGANPNAGAREVPLHEAETATDVSTGASKGKKNKRAKTESNVRAVQRSGRPDPNELMGLSGTSANNKKKK